MTSDPECRGSWVLGTACGTCPRCVATRPEPGTIVEIDPDDAKNIELVRYQWEQTTSYAKTLEESLEKQQTEIQRLRTALCNEKEQMRRLTGRLTVKQLRQAGITVNITIPEDYDEDDDCE